MNKPLNDTHIWRELSDFRIGDFIHRWGDELEVVGVDPVGKFYTRLTYIDTDRTTQSIRYKNTDHCISKKRDGVNVQ